MAVEALEAAEHPDLFPLLTPEWIQQIRDAGATEERVAKGTVLLEDGQPVTDFFVVLDGALDVLNGDGQRITTHHTGSFPGDINTLGRRASVARFVAAEDSRILRLPVGKLQHLLAERTELSDIILRSFLARRVELIKGGRGSTRVIGSRFSADTHRIREFLSRNSHPYVWLDIESDDDVATTLERLHVKPDETPVVICRLNQVCRNPSNEQLAHALHIDGIVAKEVVDLIVIGAGPAGLAAAVYGASEGLSVIVIEGTFPGGQAGASMRIENYLGFPMGIKGQELTDKALVQAQKFGAQVAVGHAAQRLECDGPVYVLTTTSGQQLRARAVVLACGAAYRKLAVPELGRFEGNGVYYWASEMEAQPCKGQAVIVVGGGNSAGQACVFLAGISREVHHVVRAADLNASMSRYLIQRLHETPNVRLHCRTEVIALEGDGHLERARLRHCDTGETHDIATPGVFTMIGASPHTTWLRDVVALDDKGFVLTGRELEPDHLQTAAWPLAREPFPFETSRPRIFAVGDVRNSSTKRVATAVGEGSGAVQYLHRALSDLA
jgi:thioredoxin reductase (NADPH)